MTQLRNFMTISKPRKKVYGKHLIYSLEDMILMNIPDHILATKR